MEGLDIAGQAYHILRDWDDFHVEWRVTAARGYTQRVPVYRTSLHDARRNRESFLTYCSAAGVKSEVYASRLAPRVLNVD